MASSQADLGVDMDMPTHSSISPQQPRNTKSSSQVQQNSPPARQSSLSLQSLPKDVLDNIITEVFGWKSTAKVDKDNEGKYLHYGHKSEPKVLDPPALAILGVSRALRARVREFLEDRQL